MRMNLAASRFSRRDMAGVSACVVLMLGVGGYIFYNTHILNRYRTTFKIDEERAQYEKKYRQYWSLPQPRITDVTGGNGYLSGEAFALGAAAPCGWRTRPPRTSIALR